MARMDRYCVNGLINFAVVTCSPQQLCNSCFFSFSVAGSAVWNSLPENRNDPAVDCEHFSLAEL